MTYEKKKEKAKISLAMVTGFVRGAYGDKYKDLKAVKVDITMAADTDAVALKEELHIIVEDTAYDAARFC